MVIINLYLSYPTEQTLINPHIINEGVSHKKHIFIDTILTASLYSKKTYRLLLKASYINFNAQIHSHAYD